MAFDAFVKIDTIQGECTDEKHKDWVAIQSFSHGMSQQVSASASAVGGRTTGRVDMQDFSIVKYLDRASPKLSLACCNGEHLAKVTVELCKAGKDPQKYMEFKLSDVVVASVRTGGSCQGGDALPTEEVSFHFGKIEWTYSVLDSKTGKPTGNVPAMWDLSKGKGA
jgi:type VI secretion system secreted protein Hcp